MSEPTIDDYVEEVIEKVREIVTRASYNPERAADFIEILRDRLEDESFNQAMT